MESGRRAVAAGQYATVNPRPSTRGAACAALLWTEDSIDRLEAGETPIVVEGSSGHAFGMRAVTDSRAVIQLRIDLEQLRRDHLTLAATVASMLGADHHPSSSHRPSASAADVGDAGIRSAPGSATSRPAPRPDDGDHITS